MRTTVTIDDELVSKAKMLSGTENTSQLLNEALEALVVRESSRRLAALGGSDPQAQAAPRHRHEEPN
jgi:Arc/MetJ family transcription regulator